MDKTLETLKRKIGYKGCRNCANQIDVLRTCEWMERGGDKVLHLICPRWVRKEGDAE
jgi:hypothetical protein